MNKFNFKKMLLIVLVVSGFSAQSQKKKSGNINSDNKGRPVRFNHVKLGVDLVALPGVVSLAYERKLTKKVSALVAVSFPTLSIPADPSSIKMKGIGFQPEIRYYLGKNAMRGWYFGLYYIHAGYSLDYNTTQTFTATDNFGNQVDIPVDLTVSLPLKHDGVGISMGPQFLIGNRVSLGFQFACSIGSKLFTNPVETNISGTGTYDKSQISGQTPPNQHIIVSDGDFKYDVNLSFNQTNSVATLDGTTSFSFINLPGIYPKFGFSLGYVFGK